VSIEKLFRKDCKYTIKNGKFIFKHIELSNIENDLDKLKNKVKKYQKIYYFLIDIISPVYLSKDVEQFINRYIGKKNIILNVGSGNSRISKEVYNIDFFEYDNVDIVCDIADLPFEDNSVDIVLNIAVLEHVPYPQKVLDEIYRILKPNGYVYTAFPFVQGFHASPYDFTRVTEEGIKILHKNFEELEVKPFGGPTSGMLWIFQEWVAILFSFGNKKMHMLIYLVVMVFTFPVKYLDYFLLKHPLAKNIASGFTYIGKK
jgi:SAM-dependent methyltransferase